MVKLLLPGFGSVSVIQEAKIICIQWILITNSINKNCIQKVLNGSLQNKPGVYKVPYNLIFFPTPFFNPDFFSQKFQVPSGCLFPTFFLT